MRHFFHLDFLRAGYIFWKLFPHFDQYMLARNTSSKKGKYIALLYLSRDYGIPLTVCTCSQVSYFGFVVFDLAMWTCGRYTFFCAPSGTEDLGIRTFLQFSRICCCFYVVSKKVTKFKIWIINNIVSESYLRSSTKHPETK